MKFIVEEAVFEKLKGVCFGVIVARGIDNKNRKKEIEDALDQSIAGVRENLREVNLKEHPPITAYRDAFTTLGFNPNKYMCSIEALTKRIMKGGEFPRINNVVDLGNAISLKYILPLGAHDIDKAIGDLEVRFSKEGDIFLPFGMTEAENVEPGELVYVSGSNVKTRKWIWRQSDEGKIDEETTNIFFPIDAFKGKNEAAMIAARDELAKKLEQLFQCDVKIGLIDENNTSMDL